MKHKRFDIGDTFETPDIPVSEIVGIDEYALYSHSGIHKQWISYTLESKQEGLYKRWWLTDEKSGVFVWTDLETLPDDHGTLDLDESGICTLIASGDSKVSSPYSSVLFYQKNALYYCSEVFCGSTEVLYMQGRKITL